MIANQNNILTALELSELSQNETIIESGLKTFIEVGGALSSIRDQKLYRQDYDTFEDYCRERWGMSDDFARKQIRASEVIENLSDDKNDTVVPELPQSERVVRPLTQLSPEQQKEVWQEVSKNGQPTAKEVKKAVDKHKQNQEILTTKKTHIVKNWYTLDDWQKLDDGFKSMLLSKKGRSTFNQTNDNIEWARYSWNPITGCLHNCDYCYARDIASRFYGEYGFNPTLHPDRLTAPANTKQKDLSKLNPIDQMGYSNVFVCSMSDLFGKWVPEDWIEAAIKQVKNNPQWTFLFLTKFPIRMAEFSYPDNVWLGTTVDKQFAVGRAEKAFVKIKQSGFEGICWLSCEPMMERLTFSSLEMFDWVALGGSSSSTQTEEFKPPREWINHLEAQARKASCSIYEKTNLLKRIREYPNK